MRQVFISYSHTDKLRAEELARHLRHSGVRVFLDLWGIGIGERIANVISDALNASSTVIVLATRESLSKQWVEAELDSALNLELKGSCRLLVVKLEPCLLPTLIQGKRYLEVHDHWTRDSLKQLEIACEPNIHRNG